MGVYLVYSLSKYQVITRSYQLNKDCTTISHSASPNGRSSTGVLGLLNAAKALHVYNHYLADIVPFKRDPLPFAKSNCGDGAWDTRYRSSWVAKKGLRRIVLWTSTLDSASRKLRSRFLVTVWVFIHHSLIWQRDNHIATLSNAKVTLVPICSRLITESTLKMIH